MNPKTLLLHLITDILVIPNLFASSYKLDIGLKWGQKCKIPGPNEFLKPSEECEMNKGLHCQLYQQGNLCGCLIRSSLSYDERSGECRRKPGHHCPFINTTEDTRAYENLPYNHKCHERAECVIIEPLQDQNSNNKKSSSSSSKKSEQFAVCRCKSGYKESRDGLGCQSVNHGTSFCSNFMVVLGVFTVTVLFNYITGTR